MLVYCLVEHQIKKHFQSITMSQEYKESSENYLENVLLAERLML